MEGIGGHQERIGALPDHFSEGAVEFIRTAHRDGEQLYPQRLCRHSQLCELGRVGGIIRIPKKGYARKGGNNLFEELQPFASDLRAKDGVPSELPPGLSKLATSPAPTGSPTPIITMGIVVVACLAARVGGVPNVAMRSTGRWASSAATHASRSGSPPA